MLDCCLETIVGTGHSTNLGMHDRHKALPVFYQDEIVLGDAAEQSLRALRSQSTAWLAEPDHRALT